ncbi:ATP-dependent DNA helicase [Janibacter cremeus]|uniref:ATP-dependent helicase n=1 Tax=Janibacter cremeus TaxID=1285192 RepID=UPI0023F7CDD1|nr:ATP-dependent DNA helicase [Janibacter cremeus]WEV78141.1 ATP-dependent DNA helicase [Janibacter cremeus]
MTVQIPTVQLRAPVTGEAGTEVRPDEDQAAAVAARGDLVRVLGGPGTGKTSVAVASVLDRIAKGECAPEEVLLVSATRLGAAAARDAVTAGLTGATTEPLARTMQSLGFAVLRQQAALLGQPAPRLLSGAEQDVVLGELLAGHEEGGTRPDWPEDLELALRTRGFREELRDLLMRAIEHGVDPDGLAALGAAHERPEWVAAAQVAREYDEVTALSRPGAFDPAWVLTAAAELLEVDGEARDRVRAGIRTVVVDDAQELTAPAARLLRTLTGGGVDLVLVGDPDATVQGFRGADPHHLVGEWPGRTGPVLLLGRGHRLPGSVHAAAARVTPKIAALGGGAQRRSTPVDRPGTVAAHVLHSGAQEAAFIAHELRAAHLRDGVAWRDMAVIVRGAARQATLRRVLAARGVPVDADARRVPLREEPAARPLLQLLGLVVDLARGRLEAPDVTTVLDLLASPLVGADAVAVRRLRRALRREELAAGGTRSSDELLSRLVLDPDRLAHVGDEAAPLHRVAQVLAAGRAAAPLDDDGSGWAPGVSAEVVLWEMWRASGVAERWQATALSGGAAGARADAALDAVVALFDAAAAHQDALPASGPDSFLDAVASQAVAADSLAAQSPDPDAVALVTPQSAAGEEWHTVVLAGVQEGVWPDLRQRGSLLGSERLVDVVTGRDGTGAGAAAAVRHDETRLFHVALTRARQRVLVTAVAAEDEQPSVYLDLVDPRPDDGSRREPSDVPAPLDLTGVVATLRQRLADEDDAVVAHAVARLAELRAAGVPGADPAAWWALRDLSDDRPVRADGASVSVSPSKVQSFGDCALRWLLTSAGGEGVRSTSMEVGTLIHDIAHELGDAGEEAFLAELDQRWASLGMPPGWVTDQKFDRAKQMVHWLAAYHARAASEGWRPVATEADFRVQLGRAVLRGSVDRLEADEEGRLRVIDYKTGSSAPTGPEVEAHPQLGAYQVAIEEGGFADHGSSSAGAALVQLGKAYTSGKAVQQQDPLAHGEDPRWVHELIEETAQGMAAASFVARPEDATCRVCPVRSSCPAHEEGGRL